LRCESPNTRQGSRLARMRESLASAHVRVSRENERLNALYNETPVMMQSIDRDGILVKVNNYWLRSMGYERGEVIGRKVADFYPEESREFVVEVVQPTFFRTGVAGCIPLQLVKKSGEIIDVLFSATGERNSEGIVVRSHAVIEDVTVRNRAEKAIRESEEQFRALAEQSLTGIAVLQNGVFAYANARLAEMTGYTTAEMIGLSPDIMVVEADREMQRESLRKRISGEADNVQLAFRILRKDGSERYAELFSRSITYKGNPAFLSTLIDITEQKKLEEQLRQAQKMEAVGQLAGGVAHDFNNILSAIMGFAALMEMKMGGDDPNRYFVKQILDASHRATVLTQSLLAFSRKQIIRPERIDLCATVENSQKFLLRLLREDVELKVVSKENGLPVFADRGQIEQVLMNLVINARDSISQCGQIIIETSLVTLDDAFVGMHGFGEPGDYALLAVTDTGCGMTDAIKNNVFDPFFTTKEAGKGTGLGLAMVYGIVKQHKGAIDVYSEPKIGSTFKIYLPLDRGEVSDETRSGQDEKLMGGCETILLAEDDSALRNLAATILKQYGYTVIEATDGIDALDKFAANVDKVDIVLSDGIMPKMSGKEVVKQIRLIAPEMKAIFISGYAEDIFSSQTVLDDKTLFVQKPVQPSVLIKSVRKVLDGQP